MSVVGPQIDATRSEPALAPRTGILRALFRRKTAWVACAWIALVVISSVFARWLAPHNPLTPDVTRRLEGPSATYWLGTDSLGRDLLSRIMYGGDRALLACVEVVVVAVVIGVPLGLLAGYFGGWVDTVCSRIADILLGIPAIIVLLAVVAAVGNDPTIAMIALGIIISAVFIRFVRGSTIGIRNELFIDASRVSGLSSRRIIVRHVLPNIIAPVIIVSTLTFGIGLLFQSGLAFLGVSVQPPSPDWGAMVFEASQNIYQDPWLMVPSGGVLILTILAFNTLGDALNATQAGAVTASVAGQLKRSWRRRPKKSTPSNAETISGDGPLISVTNLSVSTTSGGESTVLVQDVSFELKRGEVLGIVGESGSGKTMTARAVINLLPIGCHVTSGSIMYGGVDLTQSEHIANSFRGRKIAMISQEPMIALDPSFTIGNQLVEPLRFHRKLSRSAAKQEAIKLLEQVGIDRPAAIYSSFPHQISGGMAQRVCIAIALSGEPELLIADEPTTALDVTVQAEILDLLRSLQSQFGLALILVTHNLGVIADIADRTIVMYAGEVVEKCSTEELFDTPAHPYSLGLMSSSPDRAEPGQPLGAIAGVVPPPSQWPLGCHFADRCPLVQPECRESPIPLISVGSERVARCIRTSETLGTRVVP